jgi:uncharacterized membrane protein
MTLAQLFLSHRDIALVVCAAVIGLLAGTWHARRSQGAQPHNWAIEVYLLILSTLPLGDQARKARRSRREQFLATTFLTFLIAFLVLLLFFGDSRDGRRRY